MLFRKGACASKMNQEPITRSLQLPHIPVTAFSETDLVLVWIYLKLRSPQEPLSPIAITSTDKCQHVHVRLHCFILTEAHIDWNWPTCMYFVAKIRSKNRLVCKNAVALAYYHGSCRLLVMGTWLDLRDWQKSSLRMEKRTFLVLLY